MIGVGLVFLVIIAIGVMLETVHDANLRASRAEESRQWWAHMADVSWQNGKRPGDELSRQLQERKIIGVHCDDGYWRIAYYKDDEAPVAKDAR